MPSIEFRSTDPHRTPQGASRALRASLSRH